MIIFGLAHKIDESQHCIFYITKINNARNRLWLCFFCFNAALNASEIPRDSALPSFQFRNPPTDLTYFFRISRFTLKPPDFFKHLPNFSFKTFYPLLVWSFFGFYPPECFLNILESLFEIVTLKCFQLFNIYLSAFSLLCLLLEKLDVRSKLADERFHVFEIFAGSVKFAFCFGLFNVVDLKPDCFFYELASLTGSCGHKNAVYFSLAYHIMLDIAEPHTRHKLNNVL